MEVDQIVNTVKVLCADKFKVKLELLVHKTRKREVVVARQSAMVLIEDATELSLKEIGKEFGNRDHSTVIHALNTVNDLLDTDVDFKLVFNCLKIELKMAIGKFDKEDNSLEEEIKKIVELETQNPKSIRGKVVELLVARANGKTLEEQIENIEIFLNENFVFVSDVRKAKYEILKKKRLFELCGFDYYKGKHSAFNESLNIISSIKGV